MFEDSTFESQGRIHTRSRAWMLLTVVFNSSILLALILIPLIDPEGLPLHSTAFLMEVPPPPPATPPPPPHEILRTTATKTPSTQFLAPPAIPRSILIPRQPEPADVSNVASLDPSFELGTTIPGAGSVFGSGAKSPVVHSAAAGPLRIPSRVAASTLIRKVVPVYPAIAIAARIEGTIVLAANISKSGTIENLRVVSGPAMLQQSALEAVKQWRYRPYLLNGEPVEVETDVNVVFTLGG
jgi:protein TonB